MAEMKSQISIAIWLLVCCAAIYAMVVLGGVTRLTGSGLSMVKWEPVIGVFPPMSQSEWEEVFLLYQQYPEFKIKNAHMDVEDFKNIFWLEYFHRLLGRMIGIIFLLPLVYFWIRKKIDRSHIPKLVFMFVLGGLQGLLGWYMVKSGLSQDPHVSQYRLTAHLGFAFIIYAYILWFALDLLFAGERQVGINAYPGLRRFSFFLTGLIFITVLSGGFVAGLKAGLAYNTFPLMNGQLVPEGLSALQPQWRNFFENVTTVQFDHRLLATCLAVIVPIFWFIGIRQNLSAGTRLAFHLLLLTLIAQVSLGISTLLLYVPVGLAATHQGGALALFTLSLYLSHRLRYRQ
ncbi:MAG: COX15/CtaA family protein [Chromatiaceae bacterium]|nr:COX15/CtaA family protein [Chromatiaceae bacterium]